MYSHIHKSETISMPSDARRIHMQIYNIKNEQTVF
jgi:hypothetical protein